MEASDRPANKVRILHCERFREKKIFLLRRKGTAFLCGDLFRFQSGPYN
jgi:hypothetical protein